MKNTVVAADGHTYECRAIHKAICLKPVSPMTNKPLAHTHLVTNHALRKDMALFISKMQPHDVSSSKPAETSSKKRKLVVKKPSMATADDGD